MTGARRLAIDAQLPLVECSILAWIIPRGAAGKQLLAYLILVLGRNRGSFLAELESPEGLGGRGCVGRCRG